MATTLRLNEAMFGIVPNTGLVMLEDNIEKLKNKLRELDYDHSIVSVISNTPNPGFTLGLPSPDHEGERLFINFRTEDCSISLDKFGNWKDMCPHQEGLAKMVEALQKAGIKINRHEMPKRFVMIIHRKPEPEPETQPPTDSSA